MFPWAFTTETAVKDLTELHQALLSAERGNNELDVHVAVALFKPDDKTLAVRSNSAGTKLIFTETDDSGQRCSYTYWAPDYTTDVKWAEQLLKTFDPFEVSYSVASGRVSIIFDGVEIAEETAATIPLALCAALIQIKLDEVQMASITEGASDVPHPSKTDV